MFSFVQEFVMLLVNEVPMCSTLGLLFVFKQVISPPRYRLSPAVLQSYDTS